MDVEAKAGVLRDPGDLREIGWCDVDVSGQEFSDPRLAHELENHPLDPRAAPEMVGICLKFHQRFGNVAHEAVRTVPDGVRPEVPLPEPFGVQLPKQVSRKVRDIGDVTGVGCPDLHGGVVDHGSFDPGVLADVGIA
jgi:hypothetical protein